MQLICNLLKLINFKYYRYIFYYEYIIDTINFNHIVFIVFGVTLLRIYHSILYTGFLSLSICQLSQASELKCG